MSLVTVGCGAAIIAPISSDAITFSVTINSYSDGEQPPVAIIHHRQATVSVEVSASCQYAAAKSDEMACFFFLIARHFDRQFFGPRPAETDYCLPSPPLGTRFIWLCAMVRSFDLRRPNFWTSMLHGPHMIFNLAARRLGNFRHTRNEVLSS